MNQIVLIALRRPYTFVVMSILIILLGTKTILRCRPTSSRISRFPSPPWSGSTPASAPSRWKDASPICLNAFLTSTVEGIKYIHSHSYYGSSITNIFLCRTASTWAGPKRISWALRKTS